MSHINELARNLNRLLDRRRNAERLVADYLQLSTMPSSINADYQSDYLAGMSSEDVEEHHRLYREAATLQHKAALLSLASIDKQIADLAKAIGGAA